jgi:uncharacterized membrane protein YkvA (DUF1232 family)
MGHSDMIDDAPETVIGDDTEAAAERLKGEEIHLPVVVEGNEKKVERGFWKKLVRVAASIPFAEDLVAAYYCTRDPKTPTRVRAILLAALAYFVVPTDAIPDFIAVFGFTDDATVLATAIALVARHVKPAHREAAVKALAEIRADADEDADTEA